MKRSFLVTTSAGFISRAVCKHLSTHYESVIGIDNINDCHDSRKRIPGTETSQKADWQLMKPYINYQSSMKELLAKHIPGTAIHLAPMQAIGFESGIRTLTSRAISKALIRFFKDAKIMTSNILFIHPIVQSMASIQICKFTSSKILINR